MKKNKSENYTKHSFRSEIRIQVQTEVLGLGQGNNAAMKQTPKKCHGAFSLNIMLQSCNCTTFHRSQQRPTCYGLYMQT